MFIIIHSKRPKIYEQRPSTELLSAQHSGPPGSPVSIASFLLFSPFNGPPDPPLPPTKQISHKLKKKNVQIHEIVIPHQFAPKQIVVNCEFLIKFIRILITFDPYVLYITFRR